MSALYAAGVPRPVEDADVASASTLREASVRGAVVDGLLGLGGLGCGGGQLRDPLERRGQRSYRVPEPAVVQQERDLVQVRELSALLLGRWADLAAELQLLERLAPARRLDEQRTLRLDSTLLQSSASSAAVREASRRCR